MWSNQLCNDILLNFYFKEEYKEAFMLLICCCNPSFESTYFLSIFLFAGTHTALIFMKSINNFFYRFSFLFLLRFFWGFEINFLSYLTILEFFIVLIDSIFCFSLEIKEIIYLAKKHLSKVILSRFKFIFFFI